MKSNQDQELTTKYMKKMYFVNLFYQMANALILPIVPFIAYHLKASSLQYGLVFTVYYIAELISTTSYFD